MRAKITTERDMITYCERAGRIVTHPSPCHPHAIPMPSISHAWAADVPLAEPSVLKGGRTDWKEVVAMRPLREDSVANVLRNL